ncbi:hypothetical protein EDC94DRAFT_86931 [Helicostylum pulchrum]|nr:hypothetical protein EDC94DRAFT_86931 [Helicostylum pulchrum]
MSHICFFCLILINISFSKFRPNCRGLSFLLYLKKDPPQVVYIQRLVTTADYPIQVWLMYCTCGPENFRLWCVKNFLYF